VPDTAAERVVARIPLSGDHDQVAAELLLATQALQRNTNTPLTACVMQVTTALKQARVAAMALGNLAVADAKFRYKYERLVFPTGVRRWLLVLLFCITNTILFLTWDSVVWHCVWPVVLFLWVVRLWYLFTPGSARHRQIYDQSRPRI